MKNDNRGYDISCLKAFRFLRKAVKMLLKYRTLAQKLADWDKSPTY
jgi:hypothetical protein